MTSAKICGLLGAPVSTDSKEAQGGIDTRLYGFFDGSFTHQAGASGDQTFGVSIPLG
jgi:hypothetical protein